jgi:hypothetical protein
MSWRHVLAVFAGVFGSFVITLVLGMGLGLAMLAYSTAAGHSAGDAARQMDLAHMTASPAFLLVTLGLGLFAVLLGNFLACLIPPSGQVLTGLVSGIVSTVISIPLFFWYPLWYDLACLPATIGPAATGGYLALLVTRSRRARPSLAA